MITEEHLIERGNKLHGARGTLLTLWQEIADHFYPERGDFTTSRHLGEEFADDLLTSYPLIVRRDLGDSMASMLRPKSKVWAHMTVDNEEKLGKSAKMWLEDRTKRQRKAMYDRGSQFIRATKEGDHDFVTFGQCVVQRETDWNRPGFLYRAWHLRDCAWAESYAGIINEIHRNWKPTIGDLKRKFRNLHPSVERASGTDDLKTIPCRAIVLPTDEYGGEKKYRQPWVHTYIDIENKHIMEETSPWSHGYTIPRWKTVSGSQYGRSPATVAALPDARLLQAMAETLLEAGQVAVRPPIIATKDAIRSDIQFYAGGITYADVDYDERTGDVLRPVNQSLAGFPLGLELQADTREMLATAFYLNKITMPIRSKDMTAYEASKHYEQYIRDVVPLFEPMETDYNGALCDDTFGEMFRIGALGPYDEVPQELRGKDIQFRFESPLHDAIEQQKGEKLQIALGLAAQSIEIDESAAGVLDAVQSLRDSIEGLGDTESWIRDDREFEQWAKERGEMARLQEALEMAQQAGQAGQSLAEA